MAVENKLKRICKSKSQLLEMRRLDFKFKIEMQQERTKDGE